MPFDWATKGADFTGALSIKTMGIVAAGQAARIATNNAAVALVDMQATQGSIAESVLGGVTQVNRNDPAAANAYVLPWKVDHAAMTRLSSDRDIFVTPDLNGCAVFVSGDRASPTVVHVNSQATILDQGEPEYSADVPQDQLAAQMNAFKLSYKMPMWDAIYQALAIRLVGMGRLPRENLELLLPGTYLSAGTGAAAVFGRREGGTWSFFWNANRRTTRFWG